MYINNFLVISIKHFKCCMADNYNSKDFICCMYIHTLAIYSLHISTNRRLAHTLHLVNTRENSKPSHVVNLIFSRSILTISFTRPRLEV